MDSWYCVSFPAFSACCLVCLVNLRIGPMHTPCSLFRSPQLGVCHTLFVNRIHALCQARFAEALDACHSFCCSAVSAFRRSHSTFFCRLFRLAVTPHSISHYVSMLKNGAETCKHTFERHRCHLNLTLSQQLGHQRRVPRGERQPNSCRCLCCPLCVCPVVA